MTLQCCSWDEKSDIWSVGCILMELYNGSLFFPTHDEVEHLAMIEKTCGYIPYWMTRNVHPDLSDCFLEEEIKEGSLMKWPKCATDKASMLKVESLPTLDMLILPEHESFKNFIKHLLQVDP